MRGNGARSEGTGPFCYSTHVLDLTTPEGRYAARVAIDREKGRSDLGYFTRKAWGIVEPSPLKWSWHMDAVCEHLMAVSRGEILSLVICIPPGMSKSLITATFWPAWDWLQEPSRRWITSTYAQDMSEKNAKLHRDLVLSDWYQERWPEVCIGRDDVAKVRFFQNTCKGWRFTTSVGGQATGRHADVLLFDDLVKAQDAEGRAAVDAAMIEKANDFWFKTMYTRRVDARLTRRVGIAQRLHHEDTPGRCIEAGYTALVLPMEYDERRRCTTQVLWVPPARREAAKASALAKAREQGLDPLTAHAVASAAEQALKPEPFADPRTTQGELLAPERFPADVVEADRANLGPQAYEAQAQQNPTPIQGLLFKNAGSLLYETLPPIDRQIITVDCTFKDRKGSDFVALQCWGVHGPNYYLIDLITERLNVSGTMDAIRTMVGRNPKAIGIYVEDKANGPAVMDMLRGEVSGIQPWDPGTASKISRAEAVAPLFTSNVWLPKNAPWLASYLTELKKFPLTKHDDQVDATTMALLILHQPMVRKYAAMVNAMRRG